MLQSLLPTKLNKQDPSYKTVEELAEVLGHAVNNNDIRNVAITGPFGSGKSSIIQTLMKEHKEFHYLPISLATLQADKEGDGTDSECDETSEEREKRIENLNRKIEYSILQQLIYKEKIENVPNSRFRRIIHLGKKKLFLYSWGIVLFIIAFFVLFEPSFARIESFYNVFNFGKCNIVFDFLAAGYLCFCVFFVCWNIIRSFANSKLNKLNLKDGVIEIKEENSIFNKHLDEILYFFQVTEYNVVVIEDLDRFETESIYLKLRELNQLINESKIIERHIVFLYAIKDDVFENEDRTKFFDYITTVIPVINPSNSKSKLKDALIERGFEEDEIPDNDLSEMAFFIQDMRILINIANEYSQYRQKLYDPQKKHLDLTKLLAMIVYKNYHPSDFGKLHRREGLVYQCLSKKQQFIAEALKSLDNKKKELDANKKLYEESNHLKENELRLLFLYEVLPLLNPSLKSIQINNSNYTLKQISENADLFNQLRKLDTITYTYVVQYNRDTSGSKNVDLTNIAKRMHFEERMGLLLNPTKYIDSKEAELQKEKLTIQSFKLHILIKKYNLGDTDLYRSLKLPPLMDVFIRRGYIDEDYYDYISYFYPGMVSMADRDLLLSMKQQIKQDYTYHIDKIDNFSKELTDYMFEHDAILNNELLDYLARKTNSRGQEMFILMMKRLERDGAPLDFLSQYYQYGKQQKEVFSSFIDWNEDLSWQIIENHTNDEEKQLLREGWLRFCKEANATQIKWLNDNYTFISSRVENIGLQKCKNLIKDCRFAKLDNNNEELLAEVIAQCCYEINTENLCLICNYLNKTSNVNPESLNLTRISDTNHSTFEKYVKNSFSIAFSCFSNSCKDESVNNILYILNSKNIDSEQKINYLQGQQNTLSDFSSIDEEYWGIAIKAKIITPLWENIATYFDKKKSVTEELLDYINYFHSKLEEKSPDDIDSKATLFEELLGTNKLDIETYRSVCKAFDNVFDGFGGIIQLKPERLKILLQEEKIAFSKENVRILKESSIYSDYLIHYHKEFISNLSRAYDIDVECAFALMNSDTFSIQEKRSIIIILSLDVLEGSAVLADKIIDILLASKNILIGQDNLVRVLETAENEKNRVRLVTQMLLNFAFDNDEISSLLSVLGGVYSIIARRKTRVALENNDWNSALLSTLEAKGFISPQTQKKDELIVYPQWPESWPEKWPKRACQIIDEIASDPSITIVELEARLKVGYTTIQRILREMQNAGFIRHVGANKGGRWEILDVE